MPVTFTHRVTEWQKASQPVAASDRFEWSDVDLFVVHYAGVANTPDGDPTDGTMPVWLRNTQNYYLTARGYSLGYNVAVDWRGESWEIRGDRFECAANKYVNGRAFAAILVTDGQDRATPAAVAEVNRLIRQANASAPRGVKVLGHYQTTIRPYRDTGTPGTDCPGVGIKAQLASGEIALKLPIPPPPPPQEDPVTDADIAKIAAAVKALDIPGATINAKVPIGGGQYADAWTLSADTWKRLQVVEQKVDELVKEQKGPE